MRRLAGFGVLLLVTGFLLWSWAGNLEPAGPPGPTMVTLEEIDAKLNGAVDVCFDNVGRFVVCGDGAVKDNLTGLFWLEEANCPQFGGINDWASASVAAAQLADGQCGLTDGSSPGDWRLPTAAEWSVMTSQATANTCLAPYFPDVSGLGCCGTGTCAFVGLVANDYWASDTLGSSPNVARLARLGNGSIGFTLKTSALFVWPVRAGQ